MNSKLLSFFRPFFFAIHQLIVWFRNIKLHWKIQLLTLFILLAAFGTTYALFHYSVSTYDDELYSNSSQILDLSMQNIENEMFNLRQSVSSLSTDEIVQTKIRDMELTTSAYEKYTNRQSFLNRLYISLSKKKYILSVNYISPSLRMDSVGSDTSTMSADKIQQIYSLAFTNNGAPIWVDPDSNDALLLVSPIREVNNLSLRSMGVIVVRIQLDKLIQDIMTVDTNAEENLYIYSRTKELYHSGSLEEAFQWDAYSWNQPYVITENKSNSNFIVSKTSDYTSWQYYYCIPYSNIFYRFTQLKIITLAIFVVIFMILSFLAIYFASSLTRPLTHLIKRMDQLTEVDFETSSFSPSTISRKDEIGQLQQSFSLMVQKIENLIQEGYVKQLTIKDYEYRALQLQINPHFMYNTLDSIYWKAVNSQQDDIAKMIFSISRLLRESIKGSDVDFNHVITLREEFQLLNQYLTIQQIRLKENFTFTKDIAPEAYDCLLPKLILQPLIENSILYSVENNGIACKIHLSAYIDENFLIIKIEDNGVGVENDLLEKLKTGEIKPNGNGIGLSNIISRLQIIYGETSYLTIKNQDKQGAVVTLKIPVEK